MAAALLSGFASCNDQLPDNRPGEPLAVSVTEILVAGDTVKTLGITSRAGSWSISGTTDWCGVSPSEGGEGTTRVTVSFGERTDEVRETTLLITAGDNVVEVAVRQLAEGQEIEIPGQDPETNVNRQVRELVLDEYYLWNEESRSSTSFDYDQPYDEFFDGFLKSLKNNTLDGKGTGSNRYLYSYIRRYRTGTTRADSYTEATWGMKYQLVSGFNKLVCRVLYVDTGGAAAAAGLKRGDWFNRVGGEELTAENYEELMEPLINPVAGLSVTLGRANYQTSTGTIINESGTVTLTANTYAASPILYSSVITRTDAEGAEFKVGYLAYSRFDAAFNSELISVMSRFRQEGVRELILDLRYNGGGAVETAELMANLIVPQSAAGKTFATYSFNAERSAEYDRTATFTPDPNSLGLGRVYIFSTGATASASELVVNGLDGIEDIRVIMIGTTTEGKNVGMIRAPETIRSELDGVNYEYEVWPVAFKCANGAGVTDYQNGLTPNGEVMDEWSADYIRWKAFGSLEEPMILKAFQYIDGKLREPEEGVLVDVTRAGVAGGKVIRLAPGTMTLQIKSGE